MATNYFCKNADVIELHFSYENFKKLPANALSSIYKHFQFDREKKAWIGKSPQGAVTQQQIAVSLGLTYETKRAPGAPAINATPAINKAASISKPQVKFASLPEQVDYPEPPEQNLEPGRGMFRVSTNALISSFENEGRKSD